MLHEIHPPKSPCPDTLSIIPHPLRKREALPRPRSLDACLEHPIPASSTQISQVGPRGRLRAELSVSSLAWPVRQVTSLSPVGVSFALDA